MAASIWSVDEITPAGEAAAQQVSWVKLVHYTDYAMPGWRYVLAATDCLAGEDTHDDPGDPKLHFCRSFDVNYAQLPEASLSGFASRLVTANSLYALSSRRYVE